jgi:deoxyribonuclease-4
VLGAHMSIAGGFHKAVERSTACDSDCLQIFTGSTRQFPKLPKDFPSAEAVGPHNQWQANLISDDDVALFRNAVSQSRLQATLAHSSYLINLASPDDVLWKKSADSMLLEIERAGRLGIPWVVVHPGSYTTSTAEAGLDRIVAAVEQIELRRSPDAAGILLENTAGQGTNLGWDFTQLGYLIERGAGPDRLGVCLDTCHAFAAGHAIDEVGGWRRMLADIEATFGFERIQAFHLNDSKKPCGSRVDRHEHIGLGHIGSDGFRRVLRSRKLLHIPMYLETPKDSIDGEDGDRRNLRVLRELAK